MGGWNIFYALINFAILAGALFLIGRKMVVKALQEHRTTIQNDLEKSAESLEHVKSLDKQLDPQSVAMLNAHRNEGNNSHKNTPNA